MVPYKGSGVCSKSPCVLLAHAMRLSRTQWDTPSFPAAPISDSPSHKDPTAPCPGTRGRNRGARGRATAQREVQVGRGKLPQQQSLSLAACVSLSNPADNSWCKFPSVLTRLSEGAGYLRTCFHGGIIYLGVVRLRFHTCCNLFVIP